MQAWRIIYHFGFQMLYVVEILYFNKTFRFKLLSDTCFKIFEKSFENL